MGDHAEKPKLKFYAKPSGELIEGYHAFYFIPNLGEFTVKDYSGNPTVFETIGKAESVAAWSLVHHLNQLND